MTFTVIPTPRFERQAKALFKKFIGFAAELENYFIDLERQAPRGDQMPRHHALWKDRLPIKCAKIGKRGGARVIMFYDGGPSVVLLMIYFKGDSESPSEADLTETVRELSAT